MRTKILIAIVSLMALAAIGINVYQALSYEPSLGFKVYALDLLSNAVLTEIDEITVDRQPTPVQLNLEEGLDGILSRANDEEPSVFVIDAYTYFEYYDVLSNYMIYALRPKASCLLISPKNSDVKALNEVKNAVLGTTGKISDEFLFRNVIDKEGLYGVTLDEIAVSNMLQKANLLKDDIISYALFEEPYITYSVAFGAKVYDHFDKSYDAILIPKSSDEDLLRAMRVYVQTINETTPSIAALSSDKLIQTYYPDLKSYLSGITYKPHVFVAPDDDVLDLMSTYLYGTNAIAQKFPLSEIRTEAFK